MKKTNDTIKATNNTTATTEPQFEDAKVYLSFSANTAKCEITQHAVVYKDAFGIHKDTELALASACGGKTFATRSGRSLMDAVGECLKTLSTLRQAVALRAWARAKTSGMTDADAGAYSTRSAAAVKIVGYAVAAYQDEDLRRLAAVLTDCRGRVADCTRRLRELRADNALRLAMGLPIVSEGAIANDLDIARAAARDAGAALHRAEIAFIANWRAARKATKKSETTETTEKAVAAAM